MSFKHQILDLLGGWENVQLMLGAKEYTDGVLNHHYGVEEKELVFDFEPVSEYYRGIIKIKYYSGYGYFVSNLSVKIIYFPKLERTPISRMTIVSRFELKNLIEKVTGKTLSL